MATHIVLVTIIQYEGKSYRMFTDWLVEASYLRLFLQLSKIPHYTTYRNSQIESIYCALKVSLIFYHLYKYKTHIC